MAFTNNGTKVSLQTAQIPAGYTLPAVDNLSNSAPTYSAYQITIAKSTVENADKAATLTALVAAVTAAVTAKVQADFDDTANTVLCNADLVNLRNNQNFADGFYTNAVVNYVCTVNIYIQIS